MVRDARREDAAAIARVHARSWQVAYAHAFPAEALAGISIERRAGRWAERLATSPPRAALLVAEVDGEVRGFASVGAARDRDEELGELYAIYVDPDHWGAGLGRALITEARGAPSDCGLRGDDPLGAGGQSADASLLRGGRLETRRRVEARHTSSDGGD
jgi:GNAT superfamily N-acetyltransferase